MPGKTAYIGFFSLLLQEAQPQEHCPALLHPLQPLQPLPEIESFII
jgi:hypothetical protein